LQPQAVSTPQSVVSSSCSIHHFGHSDMTGDVFAPGRVMEHEMWNRWLFMSAIDLEMVNYATQCVAKALADTPHSQIIEMYWNTAMQQNNIWSIAFEGCTKEILKEVCWSNGPYWILHAETGTRFEHISTMLYSIFFIREGKTYQSVMISTTLNPTQSILNSLILFWQTTSIFFL